MSAQDPWVDALREREGEIVDLKAKLTAEHDVALTWHRNNMEMAARNMDLKAKLDEAKKFMNAMGAGELLSMLAARDSQIADLKAKLTAAEAVALAESRQAIKESERADAAKSAEWDANEVVERVFGECPICHRSHYPKCAPPRWPR
jgi:DNA repair exonuclease SbcCD ATPase subunit